MRTDLNRKIKHRSGKSTYSWAQKSRFCGETDYEHFREIMEEDVWRSETLENAAVKGDHEFPKVHSPQWYWRLPTQLSGDFWGSHLVEIPLKCTSKWHQASINRQIGCSFWGFYCPYKIFDKMFRNILSLVPNRSFSSLSGTLAENGNLSWASSEKTTFTVPTLSDGR